MLNGKPGNGSVILLADSLSTASQRSTFSVAGIAIDLDARMRQTPFSPVTKSTRPVSANDSIILARDRHTMTDLTVSLSSMMQTVLSVADLQGSVKAESGTFFAKGYPSRNSFSDLDIATDLDSLTINSLHVVADRTAANLSGHAANLRSFLMSPTPVPLYVDLDADFSDVDINRLCGAYYRGQESLSGKKPDFTVARLGPTTAADSLCVLIPRNLFATLRLHSDQAEYMNYRFSPLSTEITLHDGIAKIGRLSLGAPYGSAALDWTYSTADVSDIHMDLDLNVRDFSMEDFCRAFPSLAKSSPELAAISGTISLDADGSFMMHPSMFINAPSMEAEATLHTDSLQIARDNGELRHYTHLLMMHGDQPLAVKNLDVQTSFHDNLLEVEPFTLSVGPYRILVAGVNNLEGEIYYHAGMEKWPLWLPFGVNIVGNYHHPEFRLGGEHVKDGRELHISSDLADDVHVNIMQQLKHGWLEFVAAAAKYDAANNVP